MTVSITRCSWWPVNMAVAVAGWSAVLRGFSVSLPPSSVTAGTLSWVGGGLFGEAAIQFGPAVGVNVADRADGFIEGIIEPALGGNDSGAGGRGRAGERPSIGVDDHRALHPFDAALLACSVARRDEHPVDGCVGLDAD